MPLNPKQYRDHAYRSRAHPRQDEFSGFADKRDSFATVYLSAIPFAFAEYFVERTSDVIPAALVFPIGYLLFWAFYYTYYKPGFLENRLTVPSEFDLTAIPALILGVLIWFVKVTFVELSHLVLLQWVKHKPAPPKPPPAPGARSGSGPHIDPRTAAPKSPPQLLPPDILQALHILGLQPGCRWNEIHKQYRTMAKQFHPDLNPDITDFGLRFIKVDEAYHRLQKVKSKHFPE